jgi:hypothetical protein
MRLNPAQAILTVRSACLDDSSSDVSRRPVRRSLGEGGSLGKGGSLSEGGSPAEVGRSVLTNPGAWSAKRQFLAQIAEPQDLVSC